jgi:hypothetical protein
MLLGQYTRGVTHCILAYKQSGIFLSAGLHHLSFRCSSVREREGVCSESGRYFTSSDCRQVFIESVCTVLVSAT